MIIPNIMKLKTPSGIGDCIVIKSQLRQLIQVNSQIFISPDLGIINKYRPADQKEYEHFIIQLLKTIYPEPNCHVTNEQSYPYFTSLKLYGKGYAPRVINLKNQLTTGLQQITKPYIVLHTKVRDFIKSEFNKRAPHVFKQLNLSGFNIVLLGEKTTIKSKEYQIHGDQKIYSIYEDAIHNLNNVIDMAQDHIALPNMKSIINDCSIMRYAKSNIVFGIGGNLAMAMSVGKTQCLIHDCGPFAPFIAEFRKEQNTTSFITNSSISI